MSRTNTYLRELPPGLTHIDVYWVLRLFEVTDPCAQHAVKKLLADGSGDKDRATNFREAWETLDRWVEMENQVIGHPKTMEELTRQYMREHQAERQEQVRDQHDIKPDEPWMLESAISAARDGDADARGWLAERGLHWDDEAQETVRAAATMVPGRCPGNGNRDVCVHECRDTCAVNGMLIGDGEGWQRPPDRPLASHCPDGGACKHKCGIGRCKVQEGYP